MESKFYSINSFMTRINELSVDVIEHVDLYFIPSKSFKNQFNNITIKPVAMVIKTKDNTTSFKYNDMINYLNFIPIISFKSNNDRRIYKKQQLQKLIIHNIIKQHKEFNYYESKIITVTDQTVVDKIKQAIPQSTTIHTLDEIELFD